MATTTSMDKMTSTAREMTEAQRDSFEAIAENFAATRRRSVGLANDGLELLRQQEDNARATQEWFANGVRLLQSQHRNAEFVQKWMSESVGVLREQSEHNLRTAEAFARGVRKQQEGYRSLTRQWAGAYRDFFSPFSYAQEGLKTAQQATKQGLQATQQAAQQGLRLAEETAGQTEQVIRQNEETTKEVQLRTVVFSALKTTNYDELTVDEVSKKIDGLSVQQLKSVREYEKKNKDRETLIEQIDRKIKSKNS